MDRDQAHKLIDQLFDMAVEDKVEQNEEVKKEIPEGKSVVRTKSSGDRVYYIDEEKKTRQWITNPDALDKLGFTMEDVKEIDDSKLLSYSMGPAIYRVENAS